MNQLLTKAMLVVGALSTVACSKDYSVEFEYASSVPAGAQISIEFDQIRMEDGYAVAVVARPLANDDKMEWETQLDLQSSNLSVFEIERTGFDEEREERKDYDLRDGDWGFMLWARRPGSAVLDVWIEGELEAEIPVFVNPQPE